jgi:hypothetical protein
VIAKASLAPSYDRKSGEQQMTSSNLWIRIATVALYLSVGPGHVVIAQNDDEKENPLKSEVAAPPNTESMGNAPGGAFFVDEDLYDRYEAVKARLRQVREDISHGNANSVAAMKSLTSIEKESELLRTELEKKRFLVSAFQVFSLKSEQTFPLCDEQLVIITGDNVTVRGWNGPAINCDLVLTSHDSKDRASFVPSMKESRGKNKPAD